MAAIAWRKAMEIGVVEIDSDHKKFIELVNKLEENIIDRSFDPTTVAQCLKDLCGYARSHFDREERLMRLLNFPKLSEHEAMHAAFYGKIDIFCNNFSGFPLRENAREIHAFLSQWLVHHIIMADLEIKHHLPKRPAAKSA